MSSHYLLRVCDFRSTHRHCFCVTRQSGRLDTKVTPRSLLLLHARFLLQEFRMTGADSSLVYLDWVIGGRIALNELWQMTRYRGVV